MSERHLPEKEQRDLIEELFHQTELTTFDLIRNFPVVVPRYNIARFLAHYEIFKKIIEVPGVIIDLGVFRGASTFTFAKLCEIFCPTDIRKTVFGFDTFSGFPKIDKEDGAIDLKNDVVEGGYFGGHKVKDDLLLARAAMNADRHLKHRERIELIQGDVVETIPRFVQQQGNGLKVALLNLDLDLYMPTKIALDNFVPLMTRGGIIVLDEYAITTFGGETKAVDEYFIRRFDKRAKIIKFPWHSNPTGYIEVDW